MLTRNRVNDAVHALEHVMAVPEHPPVIVVDNASTDGTPAVLARRFPDVDVIVLLENRGAAARNVGVWRARSPYVAFSDDDTWWAPGSLVRAAAAFDAHPRLAIVSGRMLVGPDEREDATCGLMAASPLPCDPALPGAPVLGFLAGASMVRRSAFLGVGGFDPHLFLGGEAALVAIDLVTAGWSIAHLDDVVVHHHPSVRRDAAGRRRLLLRNLLWVTWLRRPWRSAWRETGRLVVAACRDRGAARGFAAALRGVSWVARRRRVIPPHVDALLRRLDGPPLAPCSGSASQLPSMRA